MGHGEDKGDRLRSGPFQEILYTSALGNRQRSGIEVQPFTDPLVPGCKPADSRALLLRRRIEERADRGVKLGLRACLAVRARKKSGSSTRLSIPRNPFL
jgi:hypothetical protein